MKPVTWDEVLGDCESYREGFVRRFRKYEGRATTELDGQGRAIKVTVASFARHAGIAKATFQRWVEAHSGPPASTNRTNSRIVQAQRSVNTTPEDWDRFKTKAEDSGTTAAALLGRMVEGHIEEAVPFELTEDERSAEVEPVIDSCGVDNSFNELVETIEHWIDSAIASLSTEGERNVLTRLLKVKLNELQITKLRKFSKGAKV